MLPKRPPLLGPGVALPNVGALDVVGVLSSFLPKMLLPPVFPPPNIDDPPDPCCCPEVLANRLGVDGFAASGAELAGVVF